MEKKKMLDDEDENEKIISSAIFIFSFFLSLLCQNAVLDWSCLH